MSTVLESPIAGLNIYQDSPGPITFGYLDDTQYEGNLTWIDVDTTTSTFWTASTIYYSINGISTNSSAGKSAIIGKLRILLLL